MRMKGSQAALGRWNAGVTITEDLIVTFLLLLEFSLLFLSARPRQIARAKGVSCLNNLRQIHYGFTSYANSNSDFPQRVVGTNGTSEWFDSASDAWRHFELPVAYYLETPMILFCPADLAKLQASVFASTNSTAEKRNSRTNLTSPIIFQSNQYLSYFLNLEAGQSRHQEALCGDRNIELDDAVVSPGLLKFSTRQKIDFSASQHFQQGNVITVGGAAMVLRGNDFWTYLKRIGSTSNLWVLP